MVGATSKNNCETFEECRTPTLLNHHEGDIVDLVCTGHFLLINALFRNKNKSIHTLRLRLTNGDIMYAMQTYLLDITELSKAASLAHIFLGMANNPMLSVGKLCN